MAAGIYKIVNKVDGKFYIGSSVDLNKRISTHKYELRSRRHHNEYLQNAFNKYGEENFSFEIVEVVEDKGILIEREQHYIDTLRACDRGVGYNLNTYARGGGGAKGERNGWYGKGYLMSGLLNPFSGRTHTEENRRKFSEYAKKRVGNLNPNFGNKGGKNPLSKKIAQINGDDVVKVWGSSIDITRELGFHGGNICKVCKTVKEEGIWKKSQGYYWCYEEDLPKLENKVKYEDPRKKKVLQIDKDTGEVIKVHDSVQSASEDLGVGSENISRCCQRKRKTCKGYIFRYLDESDAEDRRVLPKIRGSKNPRARSVVQLSLKGEYVNEFPTVKEASRLLGVSSSGLYNNLHRGSAQHVTGGYRWMYKDEYDDMTDKEKRAMVDSFSKLIYKPNSRLGKSNHKSKSVVQLDSNGDFLSEYESMSRASEETGVSRTSISACCRGVYKQAGGYKWMYLKEYENMKAKSL